MRASDSTESEALRAKAASLVREINSPSATFPTSTCGSVMGDTLSVNCSHSERKVTHRIILTFNHSGPTLTVNGALGQHWSKTSPIIRQWREDFGWLGKTTKKKITDRVGVEVRVTSRLGGGIGDSAAHMICAKAALDGLVDAGVLRDDNRAYVAWQRFHAPRIDAQIPKGLIRLTLELVEP